MSRLTIVFLIFLFFIPGELLVSQPSSRNLEINRDILYWRAAEPDILLPDVFYHPRPFRHPPYAWKSPFRFRPSGRPFLFDFQQASERGIQKGGEDDSGDFRDSGELPGGKEGMEASAVQMGKEWEPPALALPKGKMRPAGQIKAALFTPPGMAFFASGTYGLLSYATNILYAMDSPKPWNLREGMPDRQVFGRLGLEGREWNGAAAVSWEGDAPVWGFAGSYGFKAYPGDFMVEGRAEGAFLQGIPERNFRLSPYMSLGKVPSLGPGDLEWQGAVLCDFYPSSEPGFDFFPSFIIRYRDYSVFSAYLKMDNVVWEEPVFTKSMVRDRALKGFPGFFRRYRVEAGTIWNDEKFFFSLKSGCEWGNLPMLKGKVWFSAGEFLWNFIQGMKVKTEGGLNISGDGEGRFFLLHRWTFPGRGIKDWSLQFRGGQRSMFTALVPENLGGEDILAGLGGGVGFSESLQWEVYMDYVLQKQNIEGETALIFRY